MTKQGNRVFIIDACVLIDYVNADISVLGQFAKKFGEVTVALDTLIEEMKNFDVTSCYRAGISVYEPNADQLRAAGQPKGQLSFHDKLLFLLARDNGWTAMTNDVGLTRACREVGLTVVRGLHPLIDLVNAGEVSRKEAERLVKQMIAVNRYLDNWLMKEFRRRIGTRDLKTKTKRRGK